MSADCPPVAAQPAQLRRNRDQTWCPSAGIVFSADAGSGPQARRSLHHGNSTTNASAIPAGTTDDNAGQQADVTRDEESSVAREFASLSLGSSYAAKPALSYFMTRETHSEAKRNGRYWQYSLYKNSRGEKPTLYYCRKIDRSEQIARLFLDEKVVGFDIEWSPRTFYRSSRGTSAAADSIKENVSVIQIASESRIAVFQLALHVGTTADDLIAPALRRVMESKDIAKVGVTVNADCTRVDKFLGIHVNSRIELSHIHNLVSHFKTDPSKINRKAVALHTLVHEHLGLPLCKDEVRTSHWDRELDITQLQYAASDAYAGLQLYHVLNDKRLALDPTPPPPAFAELKLPIQLVGNAVDDTVDDDAELMPSAHTNPGSEEYKP